MLSIGTERQALAAGGCARLLTFSFTTNPKTRMNTTTKNKTYNGWRNRQTWNVSLWIGNDEPLYQAACDFMRRYKGRAPYQHFVESEGLADSRTPDNIAWLGAKLDLVQLNEMMLDLVS